MTVPIRSRTALVFLLLASLAPVACTARSVEVGSDVGKRAADFTLTGADGTRVSLSDFEGKVVVLDFWATWCGPCEMEVPGFVALQSKYGDKGLVVLGASIDDGWTPIRPFMSKYRMNYPVVLVEDRKLLETYGVTQGIPTTFVIGRDGVIRLRHVGYTPPATFEKAIQAAL